MNTGTVEAPARWLTVTEASALLGINPNTLRTWANGGQIRAFRTPGGHRRFKEADVNALVNPVAASTPHSTPMPGNEAALTRIRRQLSGPAAGTRWTQALTGAEREELRAMGRRLVDLGAAFTHRPRRRPTISVEGRDLGRRYGAIMASHGFTLGEALQAFIFFRNLFEDATRRAESAGTQGSFKDGANARARTAFLDQVLLGTAHAFETLPPSPPVRVPQA